MRKVDEPEIDDVCMPFLGLCFGLLIEGRLLLTFITSLDCMHVPDVALQGENTN